MKRSCIRAFLFSLFCFLQLGCPGGFYLINSPANVNQSTSEKSINQKEYPYLTARIFLRGEQQILSSDLFRKNRDSDLSHLYIYCDYTDPYFQIKNHIPLFLIDLDNQNPGYRVDQGEQIISKIPLLPDSRHYGSLTLKSMALEKSQTAIINDYYQKAKDIVQQQQLIPVSGITGLNAALDVVSSVLENVAGSPAREYMSEFTTTTLKNFPSNCLNRVEMYFILPTDSHGAIVPEAKNEVMNKEFTIRKDSSNEPYAYIGNQRYTKLPYIMIDYSLSNYVYDENLLPVTFGRGCTEITPELLDRASAALVSRQVILSAQQKARESDLNLCAKALLSLQSAVADWNIKKDPQSLANLIDNYYKFNIMNLELEDNLYVAHYKDRITGLTECFNSQMAYISTGQMISDLSRRLKEVDTFMPNISTASRQILETNLQKMQPFLHIEKFPLVFKDTDAIIIQKTAMYGRAIQNAKLIEIEIFERFYQNDVEKLNRIVARTDEGENLKSELLNRTSDPTLTNCEICRREVDLAIARYSAISRDDQAKTVAKTVTEATAMGNELTALKEVKSMLGNDSPKLDSLNQKITQKISDLLENSKDKEKLKDLQKEVSNVNIEIRKSNE